jgi:hypothetical protein
LISQVLFIPSPALRRRSSPLTVSRRFWRDPGDPDRFPSPHPPRPLPPPAMSSRSAYGRKLMEKQNPSRPEKAMSCDHQISRSLSDSSSWRGGHSRSRSSNDQDVAISRDEAKSRAKVAGILGIEDGPPRPQTRQASTSRNRNLPLRAPTRGPADRRTKSPILDDVSPISGPATTVSPFQRTMATFSSTNLSTANFHLGWNDTWIWYGGGRIPQRYRGFTEVCLVPWRRSRDGRAGRAAEMRDHANPARTVI